MAVIEMQTVDHYIKNIEFEVDSAAVPKDYLKKTSRELMFWVYEQANKLGVKQEEEDTVSEYRVIKIDGVTVAGSSVDDNELVFPVFIREDIEDIAGVRLTEHQWEAVRNEILGRFQIFIQELTPAIVEDVVL